MLSVYAPKKKIVVRYLQNEKGELCRVYFAVVEINGQIFVKAIKAEVIEKEIKSTETCCLPTISKKIAYEIAKEVGFYPSPYFSKKDISFLTIQKTRAPSKRC